MTVAELLLKLSGDPSTQSIVQALSPYVPVLKRSGLELYDDVLRYATQGMWTEADKLVWAKMTDDERTALADQVLTEARDAVDRQYERDELAKQVTLRVVLSLLMSLF